MNVLTLTKQKEVKFLHSPHSTSCIQFLDRENNDKNNTLPLGKQICFTTVWGCAEILPKTFLPLINQLSCLRGDHCVGSSLTPPHWTVNFISSHLWWLALISCLLASLWINWGIVSFFFISRIIASYSLQLRGYQVEPCVCAMDVSFLRFLAATSSVFLSSLDESSCRFSYSILMCLLGSFLARWQSCDCFSSRRACLSSFWGEIRGSTHPGNLWKQTDHMFESSVSPASAFTSTIVNSPPRSRHGTLILAGKWCYLTSWLPN